MHRVYAKLLPRDLQLDYEGVACMSYGFVNPDGGPTGADGRGAAIARGPLVSKLVTQLAVV